MAKKHKISHMGKKKGGRKGRHHKSHGKKLSVKA